jgi:hypothetical protein
MPNKDEAPITTIEIVNLLRTKIPPAGKDDPTTIFTSILIAMSERADLQAGEISFLKQQLDQAILAIRDLAKMIRDGEPAQQQQQAAPPQGTPQVAPSDEEEEPPIQIPVRQVVNGAIPGVPPAPPAAPPQR